MAEIRVEVKRGRRFPAWAWILIALVIIAVVAWFLLQNNRSSGQTNSAGAQTTSFVEHGFANFLESSAGWPLTIV